MAILFEMWTGNGGSDIEPYTVIVKLNEDFENQEVRLIQDSEILKAMCHAPDFEVEFKPMKDGVWTIETQKIDGTLIRKDTDPLLAWGTYNYVVQSGFNFEEWLNQGRVTKSFSSLEEILEDENTIRQLMLVHDSVDYLVGALSNDETTANIILDNDLCAKWINLCDYALDTLYANDNVKAVMDSVDKYGYGEWVCINKDLIPKLSALTGGGVTISSNSVYNTSNTPAYGPFTREYENDGLNYYQNSNYWTSTNTASPAYIQVEFDTPKVVDYIEFKTIKHVKNYIIKASNDGSRFVDLYTGVGKENTVITKQSTSFDNKTAYKFYQFYIVDSYGENWKQLSMLQFYTANIWQPKGNVPVMTAANAPYGTVLASGATASNRDAYLSFDNNVSTSSNLSTAVLKGYVGYKFVNPINVKRIYAKIKFINAVSLTPMYSDDGTTWERCDEVIDITSLPDGGEISFDIKDYGYHLCWGLERTTSDNRTGLYISLQFYGRELKVSVPKMDSENSPWGEVGASTILTSEPPKNVFDKDVSTLWGTGQATNQWVYYKFKEKTCIKYVEIQPYFGTNLRFKDYKIEACDDGVSFDNGLFSGTAETDKEQIIAKNINNDNEYLYYRLFIANSYGGRSITLKELNFYGLDYSEKEFGNTNLLYIYDHGVEVEEVTAQANGSNIAEKRSSSLYMNKETAASAYAGFITNLIEGNYKLERLILGKEFSYIANSNSHSLTWWSAKQIVPAGTNRLGLFAFTNDADLFPNHIYSDLSTISDAYYAVAVLTNAGNQAGYMEIEEWWLEK